MRDSGFGIRGVRKTGEFVQTNRRLLRIYLAGAGKMKLLFAVVLLCVPIVAFSQYGREEARIARQEAREARQEARQFAVRARSEAVREGRELRRQARQEAAEARRAAREAYREARRDWRDGHYWRY
jgi:hypothetical protein